MLYGRASELERELPFGVWEDALAEHAEFLGVDRLERLVGEQLPELAAVLPTVGSVPAGLQDERYRTHRAVRALLEAIAQRQAVVVALDDLQWADDASLELVAHLLRRPPRGRVALALAFRPAPVRPLLATALATAERDGSVIEHTLGALSFADAEALLGADVPAPVRGEIYEAGGGNPFFLQQLARQHAAGRTVAAEPSGGGVPRAVARALEQEIAALSEDGRRLAQGAAVAGDPVDLDLAMAAAALEESEALEALDELLAGALLTNTDIPRRYRFRHPLVRLAIYDSAAEGWRIAAHGRAAAALAERGGSLAARAHHLERCARPGDAEALEVLVEAGRHAAARAPATAADRFAAALRLIPQTEETVPRRLELLVGLAQALAATGRLEEALAALGDGLALVGPELAPVRARLVAGCAMCENLLGRHAAAHARLLGALDEIGDEGSFAAADLEIELAADAVYDTDYAGAVEWAQRARAAAEAIGMPSFVAVATALECFGAIGQGQIEAAQRLREDAAARLDALDDGALAGRLDTAYYLGFGEFFCEHYDDAIRHFRRGIAVSRASGQGQFVIVMTVGLAYTLEVRGRLAEAAEHADAAVEAARLLGNDQMLCFALTADAWVSAVRGRAEPLARVRRRGDGADRPPRRERAVALDARDRRLRAVRGRRARGLPGRDERRRRAGVRGRRARPPRVAVRDPRPRRARARPPGRGARVGRARRSGRGRPGPAVRRGLGAVRPRAARQQRGDGAAGGGARRLGRRRDPGRARPHPGRQRSSKTTRPRSRCSSAPNPSSAASARCACATRRRANCAGAASRPARGGGARPAATDSAGSAAASARSPTWSRSATPTRRSQPSCSCPRRPSRAT